VTPLLWSCGRRALKERNKNTSQIWKVFSTAEKLDKIFVHIIHHFKLLVFFLLKKPFSIFVKSK
jgi:hypothetical protein